MRRRTMWGAAAVLLSVMSQVAAGPAGAATTVRSIEPACGAPDGTTSGFADVPASNPHAAAIACIMSWEITVGVAPGIYGPGRTVTRGQMASFLARLASWSPTELPPVPDAFPDDAGSPHEHSINLLAAAGIVTGRADGTFGPNAPVVRAQMATFLVRALEFVLGETVGVGAPDAFTDDDGNVHEPSIDRAAGAGLAAGTSATRFSPAAPVRRDQMASFLARGLSLVFEQVSAEQLSAA